MSEIYINTITEVDTSQETPVETTYKIEAQRLSQGNVGDSKHPVYFENGIPVKAQIDNETGEISPVEANNSVGLGKGRK